MVNDLKMCSFQDLKKIHFIKSLDLQITKKLSHKNIQLTNCKTFLVKKNTNVGLYIKP